MSEYYVNKGDVSVPYMANHSRRPEVIAKAWRGGPQRPESGMERSSSRMGQGVKRVWCGSVCSGESEVVK